MGRRALRKIDPQLDLAPYFRLEAELPEVCTVESLFSCQAPLELEVGSGKGLFLQSAAIAHPERRFLGVEVAGRYARFAAARLARRQLHNALMVDGDALAILRDRVPADSLAAIHVYFPDPWWKKRHRKRRVMNEPFLVDVVRTLRAGGRLHFWTDVEEYFQESLELIARVQELDGPLPVAERPAEHDLDYHTHFERRMRLNSLPVWRAEYVRRERIRSASPAPAGPPE